MQLLTEEMWTIVPEVRSRIKGMTSCATRFAPNTFTSNCRRPTYIGMSWMAPCEPYPASLPRTSMRPTLRTTSAKPAFMELSAVTPRQTVLMPASPSGSMRSVRLGAAKTDHPAACRRRAVASPMPNDAPVTRSVRGWEMTILGKPSQSQKQFPQLE